MKQLQSNESWLTGLRQELQPNRLATSLTSGLIVGLMQSVLIISYAALIFVGDLSGFLANGIGLIFAGAIVIMTIISLFTSLPGIIGNTQDIPMAILAGGTIGLAHTVGSSAGPQALFLTVVATMAVTTLVTGIFLWALGHFKLGSLVRFLPYPVVGGFLAGTGWLIAKGAISMMVGQQATMAILQPEMLLRWLPGVFFTIAVFFILSRVQHSLIIPGLVLVGSLLFYLVAFLNGSLAELGAGGWLLGPFPDGGLWQPLALADLAQVQWTAVANQTVSIATILIMSVVALLLNCSGLELAMRRDVDLNRELKAAGIANFLASFVGGVVGYQQLSTSTISHKLGGYSRMTGVIAGLFCLLTLLFGASTLSLFPKVILGGVLLHLGLSFLKEWVYDAWFKLPRLDYFVVILILLVAAFVGFLEAVGVGLLTAVILFVIKYSRINVIRHELSGAVLHSRVTRQPYQQQLLNEQGAQLYILQLQGFIFFGTADSLLHTIRQRLHHPTLPQIRYIILDFSRVTGIDSTANLSFNKLKQLSDSQQIALVLAQASPALQRQLKKSDIGNSLSFPDLDHALEWGEQQLLNSFTSADIPDLVMEQLQDLLGSDERVQTFMSYLKREEIATGHYLINQGDLPNLLYFIESGQLTAQLQRAGQEPIRLQTMGRGHVVGEIGFYLGQQRTAAVIADEASIIYSLSVDSLKQMESHDPDLASSLHQIIIHRLAERVNHLVTAVNALQN